VEKLILKIVLGSKQRRSAGIKTKWALQKNCSFFATCNHPASAKKMEKVVSIVLFVILSVSRYLKIRRIFEMEKELRSSVPLFKNIYSRCVREWAAVGWRGSGSSGPLGGKRTRARGLWGQPPHTEPGTPVRFDHCRFGRKKMVRKEAMNNFNIGHLHTRFKNSMLESCQHKY